MKAEHSSSVRRIRFERASIFLPQNLAGSWIPRSSSNLPCHGTSPRGYLFAVLLPVIPIHSDVSQVNWGADLQRWLHRIQRGRLSCWQEQWGDLIVEEGTEPSQSYSGRVAERTAWEGILADYVNEHTHRGACYSDRRGNWPDSPIHSWGRFRRDSIICCVCFYTILGICQ